MEFHPGNLAVIINAYNIPSWSEKGVKNGEVVRVISTNRFTSGATPVIILERIGYPDYDANRYIDYKYRTKSTMHIGSHSGQARLEAI